MAADPQARRATVRPPVPARLPSENVIISAPMSYTGSAQRIMRLRRHTGDEHQLTVQRATTVALIAVAWTVVTLWYLMWGLLLVPYRLLRRNARKRRLEELRHRELLGSLAARYAAEEPPVAVPTGQRIGDAEREHVAEQLREHLLAGRLSTEEFEERLDAAHRARTWADLADLTADLPQLDQTRPSPPPTGRAGALPPPPRR